MKNKQQRHNTNLMYEGYIYKNEHVNILLRMIKTLAPTLYLITILCQCILKFYYYFILQIFHQLI